MAACLGLLVFSFARHLREEAVEGGGGRLREGGVDHLVLVGEHEVSDGRERAEEGVEGGEDGERERRVERKKTDPIE